MQQVRRELAEHLSGLEAGHGRADGADELGRVHRPEQSGEGTEAHGVQVDVLELLAGEVGHRLGRSSSHGLDQRPHRDQCRVDPVAACGDLDPAGVRRGRQRGAVQPQLGDAQRLLGCADLVLGGGAVVAAQRLLGRAARHPPVDRTVRHATAAHAASHGAETAHAGHAAEVLEHRAQVRHALTTPECLQRSAGTGELFEHAAELVRHAVEG